MNTKHIHEPWHADGCDVMAAVEQFPTCIAECLDPDTARRIVACVNACAGIPTSALEVVNLSVEAIESLSAQRDKLLEACKRLLIVVERNFYPGSAEEQEAARAAIAKATGAA